MTENNPTFFHVEYFYLCLSNLSFYSFLFIKFNQIELNQPIITFLKQGCLFLLFMQLIQLHVSYSKQQHFHLFCLLQCTKIADFQNLRIHSRDLWQIKGHSDIYLGFKFLKRIFHFPTRNFISGGYSIRLHFGSSSFVI